MGNTSGAKYKHFFYNVNRARIKSGQKQRKAIDRYISLLKKEEAQGETKWIYKTKLQASARLKKYGITQKMVNQVLEKR
jgi:hypothetical protein